MWGRGVSNFNQMLPKIPVRVFGVLPIMGFKKDKTRRDHTKLTSVSPPLPLSDP
jgi:hypothetical protein